MTKFLDGPAMGQILTLGRCPIFLRVVNVDRKKWDALNNLDDTPAENEEIYAYVMETWNGMVHVNAGRGRGGFYGMCDYKKVDPQPPDEVMRDNAKWTTWCETNATPELRAKWKPWYHSPE